MAGVDTAHGTPTAAHGVYPLHHPLVVFFVASRQASLQASVSTPCVSVRRVHAARTRSASPRSVTGAASRRRHATSRISVVLATTHPRRPGNGAPPAGISATVPSDLGASSRRRPKECAEMSCCETRDVTNGTSGMLRGDAEDAARELRCFAQNDGLRRWKHGPWPHEKPLVRCLRNARYRAMDPRARNATHEMTPGGARDATFKMSNHPGRHQGPRRMKQWGA